MSARSSITSPPTAGPTRWARRRSSYCCPAYRTPTRAPNCGTTPWWTRTTAARSTSPPGRPCWPGWTPAGGPPWMPPGRPDDGGWRRVEVPDAKPGTDYAYLLGDDEPALPDPRSRWQPYGVHGPSRTYDHDAFEWRDARWTGRQLPGSVLYELHIGTF